MSSLIESKPSNFFTKVHSCADVDTLRGKLRAAETKYSQLSSSYDILKQQLLSNQETMKSLHAQVADLKQKLSKQQLFHSRAVEYLNQELKLRMKSQKVWIDYLKRQNDFLKKRLNTCNSESLIKESVIQRMDKNPANMLILKIEEMATQTSNQQSKFKKLLIPFFTALYQSTTTDELFEQCIKLFQNCGQYEAALHKGQRISSMIDEFKRQAEDILGDEDSFEINHL